MMQIVGPDAAARKRCPLTPSIIKWASVNGKLELSRNAKTLLDREEAARIILRTIRETFDRKPLNKLERDVFGHVRTGLDYIQHVAQFHQKAILLADEVGVGKTPLPIIMMRSAGRGRHLVITTNSAKYQWERAIRRWGIGQTFVTAGTIPEQESIIRSIDKSRGYPPVDGGWVITHWESLIHCREALLERTWTSITADEIQFAANRKAQRSEVLHDMEAEWRFALTAHPYSKSPEQLFSILKFLQPHRYTSFWRYFFMHVEATPKLFGGYDIEGASRPKLLRWELEPLMLRRTRKEVRATLPPITRVARLVTLTSRAQREYDRLRKQFFVGLEGRSTALPILSVLARTTRLRQYLVDPGLLGSSTPSVKYPEVARLLREFEAPTVIFTSFLEAGLRLKAYLAKQKQPAKTMVLGGHVKKASEREALKRSFLRGKLDALIVVTQLGGTALNLGRYGLVMHLDLPWTPKDYEQTEGRVDRPDEDTGKSVPTTSYRIIVEGSYESRIEDKLENRNWDFKNVFSPKELRELFQ